MFVAAALALALAQDVRPNGRLQDSAAFLDANIRPLPALSAADTRRIDSLIRQMTVKEKVGQMTQLEIGMITEGSGDAIHVAPDKLRKAVVDYGVGALLNVKDAALSPAKWHEIIRAVGEMAAQTRLKIPVVYGLDTIHGANYVTGATLFPQPLGMAATWNPELMLRGSEVAAAETRAGRAAAGIGTAS